MKKLYSRKLINTIFDYINDNNIIVLHGARQVGKTTILKIIIKKLKRNIPENNILYFDLEDFELVDLINKGIKKFINYLNSFQYNNNYKRYLLIDEIQYLKYPSNFLKLMVDHHSDEFKLIVSGSSSFEIKNIFKDSLVGRTVDFEIFGLDFKEFLEFKNKKYDLNNINDNKIINKELRLLFEEYVLYSNYPGIVLENVVKKKEKYLKQIINTYIKKDIRDLADIRNINEFNKLIRILSEYSGSLLNVMELSKSVGLARQTIEDYLMLLENTYIIKKVYPYHNNIKTELRKMPKIFFEDTGLMNLLNYREFINKVTGEMLENVIYTIIRKLIDNENIFFWRTKQGKEIDFIVKNKNNMILIESKLRYSGQSLNNLEYFVDKYKKCKSFIVTLEKNVQIKNKKINCIYPWEIFKIF